MDDFTKEKLAISMDAEDAAVIQFLPYLMQDLWELGSSPADMITLLKNNTQISAESRILDLCCGKGPESVQIAKFFQCRVKGIDIIPEFIEYAKQKAIEYGVENLCSFVVENATESVLKEKDYDCVILGGSGPIWGDYGKTFAGLKKTLKPKGYIIIDEAFAPDNSTENYGFLKLGEWHNLIKEADLEVIDVIDVNQEGIKNMNDYMMKYIPNRAKELSEKYPEYAEVINAYVNKQFDACEILENDVVCGTWLLRRVD
ncbi:MAG: class I SAM-dependent methyltransferase [Endomicrobia bacterium]|nr:class I SAM-dependent methyltransferase [Endomicrobiia bacterium]MCL2506491.1 class I SAM-dependent methyltransferase [Endomicrobiia bacterium]